MSKSKRNNAEHIQRKKSIQSQIASLQGELQAADEERPQLESQLQAADKESSRGRTPEGLAAENQHNVLARELRERLSTLESRSSSIPSQIAQLQAELSVLEAAESAGRVISESIVKVASLSAQAAALHSNQDQLSRRIEDAQAEIKAAQESVSAAEQDAARAIASATSEEESRTASQQMEKAVELSLAKEAGNQIKLRAIDAMASQASSLTRDIDELENQIEAEERLAAEAALLLLGERWNQRVAELVELGASIARVDSLLGGRLHALDSLKIPLLGSKTRHSVDRYVLLETADSSPLLLADLASL